MDKEEILLLTNNIQPEYYSDELIIMISLPNLSYLGTTLMYLICLNFI